MSKQTDKEIWKDVKGFPGYQVSNLGRVKNVKKDVLLTPHPSKYGYYHIGLYQNGVRKNLYIHRLVAEAFLDEPLDNSLEIDHIDGCKENNKVTNLEWVTRSENTKRAFKNGLKEPNKPSTSIPVRIIETNEVFESARKCADAINGDKKNILLCARGNQQTHKGLHFEIAKDNNKKPFLYDYQMEAVNNMFNGCILNGSVGSGKSRTGLFYYFKEQGGWIDENGYTYMKHPKDLYIITTAKKRNTLEWNGELSPYLLSVGEDPNGVYRNKVIVDSWNNIQKYTDVSGAFFIFDEDKVQGNGAWVKAFLKIVKTNEWIILSATAGDVWMDYCPVFIANGFYKNRTEFCREHIVYSRFSKYPKIERYVNTGRLIRQRNQLLIDMDFKRKTVPHHEDIYVKYSTTKFRDAQRTRWNPYKDQPIEQASELCYVLRRIVNEDEARQVALLELFEKHPRMIIFYSFDYELDILTNLYYGENVTIAQYNGHVHDPLPTGDSWVYIVNYNACEGWNAITTDTMVFYSQTYSYKTLAQASGRIDRLNTPYTDLYYYHLKSRSGIDLAISKALSEKKNFNEGKWVKW